MLFILNACMCVRTSDEMHLNDAQVDKFFISVDDQCRCQRLFLSDCSYQFADSHCGYLTSSHMDREDRLPWGTGSNNTEETPDCTVSRHVQVATTFMCQRCSRLQNSRV